MSSIKYTVFFSGIFWELQNMEL